jgi:hypothetical protein
MFKRRWTNKGYFRLDLQILFPNFAFHFSAIFYVTGNIENEVLLQQKAGGAEDSPSAPFMSLSRLNP